ncbi:MAG: cyclase family protein [Mailhella sp.]|nr:cyclase family protein [Mailhella sp.]
MKVIDLSHAIEESMPVYPGTEPPLLTPASSYAADGYKETLLRMYTHTGTHMDPPAHIFPGGTTLDRFPPEQFLGLALVIDCRALRAGEAITMAQLRACGETIGKADFLLFNTGWDRYWGTPDYFGDYPCVDSEVLDCIIRGPFKGIGFDAISIDPIADGNLTRHKKLFAARDIVNIENLKNLDLCGSGLFRFSCFPLKLKDADGSPVRAVAWFDQE